MSFSTPQPPSVSSDSGSSASLTPTANGYSGSMSFADPSSSSASTSASTSAPASGSLFSSEESKFITESLSSAESFDPFTIGAPGFKVPLLLPPNIASTHDHLAGPSTSSAGMMSDPTASPDMRPRTLSGQQPLHLAYSTASPQSDAYSNQTAAQRLNSFNLYGRQPSGATPPASGLSNPSYLSHLQENSAFAHPAGRHASFSGPAPGPMSPAAAAGYGKNKAWQMEQLSFLEAQASRGQQQQQFPQGVGMGGDPNRRSSTSMIGCNGPYDNILIQTPARLQQQQQQQMHQQQQQHQRPPFYPGVTDEQHAGLAMLGAQFPSSHNFGSMQQQGSLHGYQQQQGGGFSAQALAMLNGDAGLGVASSFVGGDNGKGGNSTPKGTSRTPTGNTDPKTSRRASATWPTTTTASASPSATALKRTSTGAPKTAPTQSSSLHTGPSGAVIRTLADLASLDLDLATALHRLPANLHPYFTPTRMEKRRQPHLEMLRQQHIEDGLIDARTGLEIKPELTEEDLKREAEEAEKEKKGQHTLLTTEEKKANHIASEQKRRANIRKGYEMLCDIVPSLREALEREASSKGKRDGSNDESGSDAESGDEQGNKSKSPSKKKKSTSGSSKKDESGGGGGIEIDGEKIDGRAGPRSEAVVLMKSLDHTSALVEQYKGLLGRRNRARIAIARKMGWDGLAMQPVPDIDRLLAIKVQEWWASHGDEDREEDEEEDRFGAAGGGGGNDDDEGDEEEEEVAVEESKKKSPAKGGAGKKGGGQGRKKKSIKSESMED